MYAQHITLSGSNVSVDHAIAAELTLTELDHVANCDPYNSADDLEGPTDLRSEFAANNALRTS